MRFLLRYRFGIFQQKTERIQVDKITQTDQLLKIVANKFNTSVSLIILRFKSEEYLRITPGWDLGIFGLQNGDELELHIIKQQNERKKEISAKVVTLLSESQRSSLTTIEQQQFTKYEQNSPTFNIQKYLSLEQQSLFKYSKLGQTNKIIEIFQDFPKDINLQTTKLLSYLKPLMINNCDDIGWNVLHYAILNNHLSTAKQVIKRNIDVNKITQDGYSSLHLAIDQQNNQMIKLLLKHQNIDMYVKTEKGTVLDYAIEKQNKQIINQLISNNVDIYNQYSKQNQLNNLNKSLQNLEVSQQLKNQKVLKQDKTSYSFNILKGTLFKAKSMFLSLQQRYFVLDPIQGKLTRRRFIQKDPKRTTHNILIKDMKSVRIINQKTWCMKSDFTYLEIKMSQQQQTLILAAQQKQVINAWYEGLKQAINYHKNKGKQIVKHTVKNVIILGNKLEQIMNSSETKQQQERLNKTKQENKRQSTNLEINKNEKISCSNSNTTTNLSQDLSQPKPILRNAQSQRFDQSNINTLASLLIQQDKVQFSSFSIIKQIGSGAFGKVFLAKHKDTNKEYAIKALKKRTLILHKQKRFAIEQVSILKEVNHPFIINLNFAFQTPQYLYLVLDYCAGGTLFSHKQRMGKLSENDTRFYIAQLILAIEYLHNKNILYRDLKPQNILLDDKGHIKLTDFGLSKSNVQSIANSFVGTHAYVCPQMLTGLGTNKSADLYGIGCVMYECLTGQPPYKADDLPTLYKNIQQAQLQFPKSISKQAKCLIKSLLQRNPCKRLGFKNMQQIKSDPFFSKVNWMKVLNKQISPPQIPYQQQFQQDQLDLVIYENNKFIDEDYQLNSKVNRFNNFSFTR